MLHWIEAIVFVIVLLFTVYGFFYPLTIRYRLIRSARAEDRFNRPVKRIGDAVFSFFFLLCSVKRERIFTGIMHFFILYGSLTFDTVSINHILEGFNENWNLFGHGALRSFHSAWADVFGIMVLVAVMYFIIKRWVVRPPSYTYPSWESLIIYTLLITVTLTFFLYEGAAISHHPDHAYSAFAGQWIGTWLFTGGAGPGTVKLFWWIHILNVFAFVLYVPRSKYLHMIFGPVNIAFQDYGSSGLMRPLNLDMENPEVDRFGVVKATDLRWKDILDSFACIDCGRCDDYCPANQTGKPLSPKNIHINLKKYLLENRRQILDPEKKEEAPDLMAGTYTADEIWTCTSCGACMAVCPVKNEHLPKIMGIRQSQALMESKFPRELNQFFKSMETNQNPWGFGASGRTDWTEGLEVKILAQDPKVDILYWVGCAGAFDEKARKVSAAMVRILEKAGVNFGILGTEEGCCGDQARRLGHEYLFQIMAQQNLEIFKRYQVQKILVTCPHGYNTFKNDYPAFARTLGLAWDIEVIHHSQFINQLIKSGRVTLSGGQPSHVTYHDPCYLGRHNQEFEAARSILKKSGAHLREMARNRRHSFCCGAGGGLMWTEETLGTRINHTRTEQALDTGAATIVTSCPFCMTMLDDGIKDKGREEEKRVRDIAQIIADQLK